MIEHRSSNGSTIVLVSLVIGIVVVTALFGIGFNFLLLVRARAQCTADAMALSIAKKLNKDDRIGELNELQQASRELIFVSRRTYDQSCDSRIPELNALCDQLLQDARAGHPFLEAERQNQIRAIGKEIQDAAQIYNRNRNKIRQTAFLGLQTYEPEITRVDCGRIVNVNSNVKAFEAIPELATFDRDKGYVDRASKLYKCEIDAKLPSLDSDLDFYFSSLPAYVGKTCAPSRNTNPNVFVPYGNIFDEGKIKNISYGRIPSAIQIFYGMDVVYPWERSKVASIRLIATGSTGGASADSQ